MSRTPARKAGWFDDDIFRVVFVDFEKFGVIGEGVDYVFDVIGLLRIFGNERVQRGHDAIPRIAGGFSRRVVQIIGRQVAEKLADHGQTLGIVAGDKMRDAAGGVVRHGAAQFLLGDFFMGDSLDDVRAGDEHVGCLASHENKIGDGRGINRAAGAGAHDRADLGDHAAGERIAQKNFRVAGQRLDAFLNARAAGIVQADQRRARTHGQVHDLDDFPGVGFGKRAAENREILREDVHQAAADAAEAGDESVARRPLRFHAEIVGLMPNEFVELFEAAFIEQQVHAFAGAELALFVLALAAFGAAARFSFSVELAELFEAVVMFAVRGHGRGL
jgi:hypothetical protein